MHDSSKDPTNHLCYLSLDGLQSAKLKSSSGLWFVVGEITDKQRPPHWHESGHRCGSHDSTSAGVRTRGFKSGGGHERHTRCRTKLVTHPPWRSDRGGSGEGVSAHSNPVPNLPKPTVARAQPSSAAVESSHHPSGERVDCYGPGGDVLVEVAHAVEPTTKSHAPVEEHDESLLPKRQRGRPATHCWPSPGSPEYTVGCPGCDGRSYRHLLKCPQKRVELGLTASSMMSSWKRRHRFLHLLNRHLC